MRDILFRGKVKSTGKWVCGYYWTNSVDNHFIRETETPDGEYGIWDYEVLPLTVDQYTGLTDMYGTEVWEGDIVQYYGEGWDEEDGPGVIEWDQDTARFIIVCNGLTVDFDNCNSNEVKVIGNVHDNPELMED